MIHDTARSRRAASCRAYPRASDAHVGPELDDNDLLDGWNDIYLGADAEVCALLARARSEFPLYAFTNSNPSHRAVWSERFADVLELFTSIFVSSDLGQRKPDRGAFDAVSP